MATDTAFRSIGGFHTWIFVTHEMCCIGNEIVVAVVGAESIDNSDTEVSNGTAGGANVRRGRGYSRGFASCRTFYPRSAAERGRVDGGAGEGGLHIANFGDIPSGEITSEQRGTIKRSVQTCHSLHIPFAQITGEG
jgi:hypothetical protein